MTSARSPHSSPPVITREATLLSDGTDSSVMKAIWALEVGRAQRMDIERQDQGVTCKIHKSSRSSHEFAQDTPTSWIVRRRLKLIFARIAPADAPGAPFDLSQCDVERGHGPCCMPRRGPPNRSRVDGERLPRFMQTKKPPDRPTVLSLTVGGLMRSTLLWPYDTTTMG